MNVKSIVGFVRSLFISKHFIEIFNCLTLVPKIIFVMFYLLCLILSIVFSINTYYDMIDDDEYAFDVNLSAFIIWTLLTTLVGVIVNYPVSFAIKKMVKC